MLTILLLPLIAPLWLVGCYGLAMSGIPVVGSANLVLEPKRRLP
jgi:hypothetical protein